MPISAECAALLTRLSAYLDGDAQAQECAQIEAHCAICPHCASVMEGLQRTIGACRDLGSRSLPEDVRRRARESVRRLLELERSR
jgi:anti-sigma factor RsiW